jgi:hypothetical protein
MKKILGCLVMILGFMIFSSATVGAGETTKAPVSDRWQFTIEPYAWVPQLGGTVTVKNKKEKVKVDLTDYPSLIDEFRMLLFGRVTIQKGRFKAFYDGMYIKLKDNINGSIVLAEVVLKQGIQELGLAFDAIHWGLGKEAKKDLGLEALAGARYIYLRAEGSADVPIYGMTLDVDKTHQWVDPFIGGRLTLGLTKKTSISLRGDIGGFGVSSDFIWNGLLEVKHHFNKNWFTTIGYRGMNTDYRKGSFKYQVKYFGPVASVGFTF